MSSAHASAEEQRSANDARRRKRRERAAKNRAPEPKDIVSGAGQPLDVGVRRELEEALGHDLGGVRLHTDRDADALTSMLGADAVAVGQDVFFREGAYAPGTAEGRRLLAHELLHTVQNPYGAGPLAAGRDLGAVSLPQEAAEQEAESAARRLMREETAAESEAPAPVAVEKGEVTPAWMRYATVDADRMRLEHTDPATLVDRLANTVMRALRADPEDRSKRTRMHLARLPEELEDAVLDRLESRLLSSEHEQLWDLVDALEHDSDVDYGQGGLAAPAIAPDATEELMQEREAARRDAAEQREERARPATAAGPEKEQAATGGADGSTPQNDTGTTPQGGTAGAPAGKAKEEQHSEPHSGGDASSPQGDGEQPDSPAAQSEESGRDGRKEPGSGEQDRVGGKEGKGGQAQQEQKKEKDGGDRSEAKQAEEKSKEESEQEESAGPEAGGEKDEDQQRKRDAEAAEAKKQQEQEGKAEKEGLLAGGKKEEEFPGRSSTLDGARSQDLLGEEEPEKTPAKGGDSEVEAGGGEKSAWDTKLRPEDFLPEQDLDVSNVPTADQLEAGSAAPAVPSFAAPPPTKAEQVTAEREQEDEEDAERAARAKKDDPGTEDSPPVPGAEEEAAREKQRGAENQQDREDESEPKGGTGVATKDPTLGADPKDGPAAAEAVAQEGKERGKAGGGTEEKAAREEKAKGGKEGGDSGGSPGDKSSGGGEKESEEARSDTSASERSGDGEKGTDGEKSADGAGTSADGTKDGSANKEDDGGRSGSEKSEESPGPQESRGPKDGGANGGPSAGPSGAAESSGSSSGGATESEKSGSDAADGGSSSSASQSSHEGSPESSGNSGSAHSASGSRREARAASRPEKPKVQESRPEKPQDQPQQSQSKGESGDKGGSGAKAAPASSRGRGGGGGGGAAEGRGSGKGKSKASKATPNLSGVSPEEGLAAAGNLKPHQAVEAMDSVGSAAEKDVGKEHKKAASKPPAMQRPSGSPQTLKDKPKAENAAEYNKDKAERAKDAKDEKAEVKGGKKPEGKIEAEEQEEPDFFDQVGMMAGYAIGSLGDWLGFDVSAEDLAAQFAGMPTKDEALKQAKNGNAPGVDMKGQGDEKAEEQGGHSDAKSEETAETGADDAGRKMGEDQVYPDAPKERLEGKVPGVEGGKGVGGGGAGTGQIPPDAASEVAEKKRKPQFKKAIGDGRQGIAKSREKKDQDTRKSQDQHKRQVNKEVDGNTKQQTGKREGVLKDVDQQRSDWTKEQDAELKKLGTKNSEREKKVRKDVEDEEKKTDEDVEKEKKSSDKKVKDRGDKAEKDAEKRRDDDTKESKNWLSKTLDWVKEQFIKLRDAVVGFIKAAREAVVEALKNFKETVEGWIDAARKGIVELIKKFIEDLIEFVMSLVEAIVEIAVRIRKFITNLINAALALVQKLADMLKKILNDLLEAIGKLLSKILSVLKKMFLDFIKACKEAIKAVLDFAKKIISAYGEFMMILVDILRDPKGWISGAASSAYDGTKNHLFREVKSAVKGWFDQKVKEITGLTEAVYKKLMKGGWTLEKIATEVWNAIVPQLPMIIGEIIVTKVLTKLIPGGGWGTALLETIMAAINSLSEILKAMGAVIAWLKSVRKGGAGKLFAKAIAAGIVVVLEMAYEMILSGIGKYVSKVGKRLRGIAAKIAKGEKGGKGDKGKADGSGDGGDKSKADGGSKGTKDEADGPKADTKTQTAGQGGKSDGGGKGQPGDKGGDGKTTSTTKNDNKGNRDHTPDTTNTKNEGKNKDEGKRDEGKSKDKADGKGKPGGDRKDKPGGGNKDKADGVGKGKAGSQDKKGQGKDKDSDGPSNKPGTKDKNKDNDKTPSKDSTKFTDPSTKDKNGESKNKDQDADKNEQDTKPTPSPKPKPKPKPDKDSDGSGKKDPDSDGSGKKDDPGGKKDEPGGKKDPGGDGKGRKDPDNEGKDKDEPGRPKSRAAKDERRKEESQGSQQEPPLPKVHFQTESGDRHTLLFNGQDKNADLTVRSTPTPVGKYLDAWGKENKELQKTNPSEAEEDGKLLEAAWELYERIEGEQNSLPKATSKHGIAKGPLGGSALQRKVLLLKNDMERLAEILANRGSEDDTPPLPPTILPPFVDGPRAFSFKASYIKKSTGRGTEASERKQAQPLGWKELSKLPGGIDERKRFWVRMHMLPAGLGGHASTSNLVPARGYLNDLATRRVEHPAQAALGHDVEYGTIPPEPEKMIWYKVNITWGHGTGFPGFPSRISVSWGGYKPEDKHWKEKPPGAKGTWGDSFPTPNLMTGSGRPGASGPNRINMRSASQSELTDDIGLSSYFARTVRRMLRDNPSDYDDVDDLIAGLQSMNDLEGGGSGSRGVRDQRNEALDLLDRKRDRLDF